jgi:ribosomal protein L12E/L44/L45/RPP1/RPP2
LGGRGRRISEFKASLVYRVSSRTARATEKPCLEKNQKKKKKKEEEEEEEEEEALPPGLLQLW